MFIGKLFAGGYCRHRRYIREQNRQFLQLWSLHSTGETDDKHSFVDEGNAEQEKGDQNAAGEWGMEAYIFCREKDQGGPPKTVTFEQRLGVEGVSHEDFWRKNIPDSGNSQYNSLKTG